MKRLRKTGLFCLLLLFVFCIFSYGAQEEKGSPGCMAAAGTDRGQTTGSGPCRSMPWDNDKKFTAAKLRNGTNVFLAGYRTVLRDPLPGEEYNVHLAASRLAGLTVENGRVFSQNGSIGPYTEAKGFQKGPTYIGSTLTTTIGGGVCKIASTLYNVTALCNLEIVERYNHSMPVPYVPYGQDATVAYGARDFKFRNNTGARLMIWAKGIDNILYMAFYGIKPAYEVKWRHEFLERIKAPTVYKTVGSLAHGEQKLVMEGMDGAVVKSWIIIREPSGPRERYMGVSSYKPMSNVIERGR